MFEILLQIFWSRNLFDLQKHDAIWFVVLISLYMSIISNYQIKVQFSLAYREANVNCLSIFKFSFFVVYSFKLLTKITSSTKKSEYCYVLIFFLSIVKSKHMSYNIFEFLFDIVDIDWNKIFNFNFNFDHFFFFASLQNTRFQIFRRFTVEFTFFEIFDKFMLNFGFSF